MRGWDPSLRKKNDFPYQKTIIEELLKAQITYKQMEINIPNLINDAKSKKGNLDCK